MSGGAIVGTLSSGEDITELTRVEQELGWRAEALAALHQTALDLAAQRDLTELLRAIAARAVNLLQAEGSSFWVYQPATDDIKLALSYSLKPDLTGLIFQRGEGLAGKVLEVGHPMVVADYSQWEERSRQYDSIHFGAMISVPVVWGDQPMGVLNVLDAVPRTFSSAKFLYSLALHPWRLLRLLKPVCWKKLMPVRKRLKPCARPAPPSQNPSAWTRLLHIFWISLIEWCSMIAHRSS